MSGRRSAPTLPFGRGKRSVSKITQMHDQLKRSVAITIHFHGVGLGAGVSESLFVLCSSVVCALALLALSFDLW